jgi:hypothetical protein
LQGLGRTRKTVLRSGSSFETLISGLPGRAGMAVVDLAAWMGRDRAQPL